MIDDLPAIVGTSPAIQSLKRFISRAARYETCVLIMGETGVGKELAARSIHNTSPRKSGPFLCLNCTTINENLIEIEMFGHRKGAFTGAFRDRTGIIESSSGGSLLLDEIGDTSLSFQGKLLAITENNEIRRVGETTSHKVNTRYMFATNKDLRWLIRRKLFREDLYYRIDILSFTIPPLRERREDIPPLVEMFLQQLHARYGRRFHIAKEALAVLQQYDFPGNVRELEHIILRAALLTDEDTISASSISLDQTTELPSRNSSRGRFRHSEVLRTLLECQGNKSQAATKLGISRMHLYRLLSRFD